MAKTQKQAGQTLWTPQSWRDFPIVQQPEYASPAKLVDVEKQLASFPPLTSAGEAAMLKRELAEVCEGRAFLLQGGDCAESFAEFSQDNLRTSFKISINFRVL